MKTRTVVLLLLVLCTTAVLATSPAPLASNNCSDDLAWMASSSTSPNDTACRTWSSTTDTSYDWVARWNTQTEKWEFYLQAQSPLLNSHNSLIVGGGLGPEFQVSNLTIVDLVLSWGLQPGRDGFIIRVSTDGRTTWYEVTSRGITLSLPYTTTMSTSTQLEPPPVGLRGIKAYTGTMPETRIRLDFRNSTILGQTATLQLYSVFDNAVGVEGIHLTGFNYWDAPLEPPVSVSGEAGNTEVVINSNPGTDPRRDHSEIWDNGVSLGIFTSRLQLTGLANGSSHAVEIKNFDSFGNEAGLSCSPSPLIPTCTGAPGMTLLQMSTTGGQWVAQTAEVPCGTGVGPVDGQLVYRSAWPDGPWSEVGSVTPPNTQFFDSTVLPGTNIWFYRVRSTKGGVLEPWCFGNCPPST